MSDNNSARIINKVKGLLAIAADDAASDGEIQACLTQVRRLMDKHQLSEDDLKADVDPFKQVDEAPQGTANVYVGRVMYSWEGQLLMVVAQICAVGAYRTREIDIVRSPAGIALLDGKGNPRRGTKMVFYGITEDCQIAAQMFQELRELICTMAMARYGAAFKGDGGRYSEGFVHGINSQFKRERDEEKRIAQVNNDSTALVLVQKRQDLVTYKRNVAAKYIRTQGVHLRKTSGSTGASGSFDAYAKGRTDGSKTNVAMTRRKKLC